jgi:hypothetical protein
MDLDKALEQYTKIDETPFCFLFDLTHSDKGNRWHQYSRLYYTLLRPYRDTQFNLFELGIGTNNPNIPSNMGVGGRPGASLLAWKLYFKQAQIYAADIDRAILDNTQDRIHSFYCDQTSPESVQQLWQQPALADKQFLVLIDDGLHLPHANLTFFEHSIHKLQKGGIYIIEDIHPQYSGTFVDLVERAKVKYPHLDCRYIHVETATQHKPEQNYVFLAHYKN